MKKFLIENVIVLLLATSIITTPASALMIKTGIWNEATSAFTETSYYTGEEVSAESTTRLRFTFDLEEPVYSNTLYMDLFATYDGTEYQMRNMMDASPFVEADILGNLFANHDFHAYGDMSLLTEVRVIGYYGEETAFATMTQGAEPNTAPVPEPATMLLLGTGLVGILGFERKKASKHPYV